LQREAGKDSFEGGRVLRRKKRGSVAFGKRMGTRGGAHERILVLRGPAGVRKNIAAPGDTWGLSTTGPGRPCFLFWVGGAGTLLGCSVPRVESARLIPGSFSPRFRRVNTILGGKVDGPLSPVRRKEPKEEQCAITKQAPFSNFFGSWLPPGSGEEDSTSIRSFEEGEK